MYSHENCDHPRTKVARAACRREQEASSESKKNHPAGKRRNGPRLPSMIAPKLRPLVDKAKAKGLKIRLSTDMADDVEQAFVISNPKRPDCELIAEAFRSARGTGSGRTEYWHIEDGLERQLSRQRALEDIERLAKA